MSHLFSDKNGTRGKAKLNIAMHELYSIIRGRLQYIGNHFDDPDAVCQNICVKVEELNGTYPNLPFLSDAPVEPTSPLKELEYDTWDAASAKLIGDGFVAFSGSTEVFYKHGFGIYVGANIMTLPNGKFAVGLYDLLPL